MLFYLLVGSPRCISLYAVVWRAVFDSWDVRTARLAPLFGLLELLVYLVRCCHCICFEVISSVI